MKRKYRIARCECGSESFTTEFWEPIRCEECGSIPKEVPPTSIPVGDIEIEVVEND